VYENDPISLTNNGHPEKTVSTIERLNLNEVHLLKKAHNIKKSGFFAGGLLKSCACLTKTFGDLTHLCTSNKKQDVTFIANIPFRFFHSPEFGQL